MFVIVIFIYKIEENSTPNIDKEKQMYAEKTPLHPSDSRQETRTLDTIQSTNDFLNTGTYQYCNNYFIDYFNFIFIVTLKFTYIIDNDKSLKHNILLFNIFTVSKSTPQSKEKLSLSKRGKRAVLSNDDENEISIKTQRIQKLLEQEMELNTLKIEHEKKISILKEQHLIQVHKYELRAAIATAETAELQLEIKKNETLSLS